MSELVIKTHNFEVAKKGLKDFSQKKAEELEIDTVRTDVILGIGKRMVTGYELNSILGAIQQHLIDLNNTNNRTIKEFGQVYSALEALDKDYIQAILISIKATEETSKSIEATQEHIKRIVDDQKKTLEVLKKFKQKLDNYAHLGDIDKIWSDCQEWHKDITTLSNLINNATSVGYANAKIIEGLKAELKTTDEKTADLAIRINQQIAQIESISAFTHDIEEMWESLTDAHNSLMNICNDLNVIKANASKQQSNIETLLKFMDTLSGYKHLKNIDEIWSKTEAHSDRLDGLAQQSDKTLELVRANQSHIDELSKFKEELCGIAHLNDVDELWNSNEVHSNKLSEFEKQREEANNLIQENKKLIDAAITNAVEKNDTDVQMLTQKIKYAYLLAGGSLGLAIIEMIVILLKVI
jgi:DNA repair exonuclease SbcCD ATPase subunit